ncbi:MAG: hypothetical protein FWG37_04110, partial [Clostridia bacterium]|nr:hypothetical protein [Clostridia bacterium]
MIPRQATIPWLIAGFIFILLAAIFMASHTGTNFFAHSVLDSYSLQAIAWRNGRTSLDQDYPWLELAIYKGDYYVSFPPVPTLPMLLMTFFFGVETPNAFASLLYFLSVYL